MRNESLSALCNRNDEVFVSSPVPDYVKATVETVMKIHETEDDGDVLAFLTGQVCVCWWTMSHICVDLFCNAAPKMVL